MSHTPTETPAEAEQPNHLHERIGDFICRYTNPEATPKQKRIIGLAAMIGTPIVLGLGFGLAFGDLPESKDLSDPVVECAVDMMDMNSTHADAIYALGECGISQLEIQIDSNTLDDLAIRVIDEYSVQNG